MYQPFFHFCKPNSVRGALAGLTFALVFASGCSGSKDTPASSQAAISSSVSSSLAPSSASVSSIASSVLAMSSVSSVVSSASQQSSSSADLSPRTIAPNNPAIRYIGRVHVTASEALYDWANVQFEFKVSAPAVELLLSDGINDYNVFVDEQLHSTITTVAGRESYPLTLGASAQHIRVTKRTGPNFGAGRFKGIHLPQGGELLALPAEPARNIEFIGDSYTVGYGNEGPGLDCGGVYRPFENSFLSYAPITARALGAKSHSVAISGFGAVRNYGDADTTSPEPLPAFYGRTLMSRADLAWDFNRWVPDAVVIKLGTNDHSTEPNPPADVFIQGIHGLIDQVNQAYGQLPIFLLADSSLPQVITRMQAAASEQQAMGNAQVQFVQVAHPPQAQLGCDWHPLVVGHQAMADELAAKLRTALGWQNTPVSNSDATFTKAEVTTFKGNAKGAYSMVLDDYCAAWVSGIDDHAIPTLKARGLKAGLGALASECKANGYEQKLKAAAEQGLEIINHTWTHPALVPCNAKPNPNQACSEVRPDLTVEIDQARSYLEQASGAPVDFFVFPYNSVDDVVLNHLREQGYLGARGGSYTLNAANFSDPLRLSLLGNQTDMNALADQAINGGAFAFINLHGIADASYEPVTLDTWVNHLDYLALKVSEGVLWVDTPTAIVKYNRTRALCGTPRIAAGELTFEGAMAGCQTYQTPVTVKVTTQTELDTINPTQQGALLNTTKLSRFEWLIHDVDVTLPVNL